MFLELLPLSVLSTPSYGGIVAVSVSPAEAEQQHVLFFFVRQPAAVVPPTFPPEQGGRARAHGARGSGGGGGRGCRGC